MNPLTLQLHRSSQPARPVVAWLLRGGDAGEWLAEIARWQVDDSTCHLYVLPCSREDASPGAALVLCPETPATPPAAAPYAVIAGGIFLPADAILLPAATDAELTELRGPGVLIFHPALGAIHAERRLTVAEVIRGTQELDEPFADAIHAPAPHGRIEAVGFRMEQGLDALMQEMRDDIGTEPEAELPPARDEPKDGPVARGMRSLRKGGLNFLGWLLRGVTHTGPANEKAGPFGKMLKWVGARLGALTEEMEKARKKSLHRLLEQLKDNPDEALKHALPLSSKSLDRGRQPPGGELGTRNTNFSLDRLRGGGRSDNWNLDEQIREDLRQNYMRLAERERQLGRFRRAAYIYAELLGDLSSAAAVLKEGKMWREAAIIYRDHLRQAIAAAECFVEARLLREAVEIYEKERAYDSLGRLYRQLGDKVRAEKAFLAWVETLRFKGLFLDASKVLLQELDDRERALMVLLTPWRTERPASECLDRWFELRATAGEHVEARALVLELGSPTLSPQSSAAGLQALARLQTTYPEAGLRAYAEDIGRQQIARALAGTETKRSRDYARMLPPLCPADRLLARDAQRFASRALPAPKITRAPVPLLLRAPAEETTLQLLSSQQLPKAIATWRDAVVAGKVWLAVGTSQRTTLAVAISDEGQQTHAKWQAGELNDFDTPLLLCPPADGFPNALIYHPTTRLAMEALGSVRIGAPSWLSGPVFSATISHSTLWLLRHTPTGLTLSGHRRDGTLVNQLAIAPIILEQPPEWQEAVGGIFPSLIAFGEELAIAVADRVVVYLSAAPDRMAITSFDGHVLKLIPGPRWAKPHFAAVFRDRVEVCWLNGSRIESHFAHRELENPCAGFTTDGTLVIIAGTTGYLVKSDSQGNQQRARFSWAGSAPVSILPAGTARRFAVLGADGYFTTWNFSANALR